MDASGRTDSGYTTEIITDERGLDRVAGEWTALNEKCGPDGFFTRIEVVRENWARHKDEPRKSLHVLLIRKDGKLVLAAPMVKARDLAGTHTLRWLDSRTPLFDDALMDPGADLESVALQFARHVRSSWMTRALKLGFVLEGSALHHVLEAAEMPLEPRTVALSTDISAYSDWDEYLAQQSASRGQQYRYYNRRLQRGGARPVEVVTDPAERRAEIARLFSRKRQWVTERGDLAGWIVPEETETWFQNIAGMEDARNRTHLLRFASETDWIAGVLLFERDGTMFLSKIAHNPAWNKCSPGWLLILEAIRFAIERKQSSVDLMIGRGEWKDRVSNRSRQIFKGRVSLWPSLRRRRPSGRA